MRIFELTVGPDGRVVIPDTRPGQTITIQMTPGAETATAEDANAGPIPEEERAAIKARVMRRARMTRQKLPEPWRTGDHGDLLYGDGGLPT